MKKYLKPMVEINEDMAEGVYAASGAGYGAGGCWTITKVEKQSGGGHERNFQIDMHHDFGAQHISLASVVEIEFNYPISNARIDDQGEVTWSGNKVTIKRELHGNAYQAGDLVTYKVHVTTAAASMLDALAAVRWAVDSCDKTVNVQGNGGDE